MRTGLLVAAMVAVVGLSGCVDTGGEGGDAADGPSSSTSQAQNADGTWNLAYFGAGNDPVFGNASAPVQVIAYDAPGCPSCAAYHAGPYQSIIEDYVDTGRIGYHALQWRVGYAYDIPGSIAEECVFRDGGAMAYDAAVAKVFANRTSFGRNEDTLRAIITETADDFGFDADVAIACFDNGETEGEVYADIDGGRSSGAGSNPGFAVLGPDGFMKLVQGRQGPADAIEEALARVEGA